MSGLLLVWDTMIQNSNPSQVTVQSPKTTKRFVFYESFYRIIIISKFFGLFPNSNIGVSPLRKQPILYETYNISIISTVIIACAISADIFTSLFYKNSHSNTLESIATALFENFTRFCGFVTVFYMVVRAKFLVNYINNWNKVNSFLLPHAQSIKRDCSITLCVKLLLSICCLFLTGWSKWSAYFVPFNVWMLVLYLVKLAAYTLSLYNLLFVVSCCLFFSRTLVYGFRTVTFTLSKLLEEKPHDLPIHLDRLRQKYQQLCDLTTETNKILSPLLAIIVIGFSVSLCVLIYLVGLEIKGDIKWAGLIRLSGSVLYRCVPVILVCLTGQQVTDEVGSTLCSNKSVCNRAQVLREGMRL